MLMIKPRKKALNEGEVLLKVKDLVNEVFIMTAEASYNDPKTARELRKAAVNSVSCILNGFKSAMDNGVYREFKKAMKFITDLKWHTCISLENRSIKRPEFNVIMQKAKSIENTLDMAY